MSLIHWWPFNNNTTDSITSLSLTGSVTYSTGGKVTPSALKSTSTLTSTTPLSKLSPLNNGFSFACWLKINQNEISTHFNSITSSYTIPTGTLIGYNNYGGTALIWKANSLTSFSKIYIEGTIRGNGSYATPQHEIPFDKWVHITMVKDTVLKKIILYINGVEVKSTSIASLTSVSYLNQYISINRNVIAYNNGPATILPCYLNDVRVYDHALSPREVKLLAQGLVAHYKLDDPRINNLAKDVAIRTYDNHNKVYDVLNSTGETYLGCPVYRLTLTPTTSSLNNFQTALKSQGVYQSSLTFAANTKYCYWIYYKPITHSDIRVGGTASNIKGWTELPPEAVGNGWYRVGQYRDGKVTETKTDGIYTSFFTPSAAAGVPITIDFCAPHLLAGPTNWVECQYTISNSGGTEYDCSGYNNNATISGTITCALRDSPRYQNSYIFNGNLSNRITNTTTQFNYTDNFSWSCWIKHNYTEASKHFNEDSSKQASFAFTVGRADADPGRGYGLREISANTMDIYFGNRTYRITLNESNWHHIAFTKSDKIITTYVDGVPTSYEFTGTSPGYTNNQGLGIGCFWYSSGALYPFYGRLSDFRIYATALSAAAVKELYQSSISFLDNGTLQCSEIVEKPTNLKYNKNGTVQAGLLSEVGYTNKMKTKTLSDGSAWARIHWLDVANGKPYFANEAEVQECIDKTNRFSMLKSINHFYTSCLPAGYQRLDYIQPGGTYQNSPYIDTGVIPDNNTKIVLSYVHNDGNEFGALFGARIATTDSVFGAWIGDSGGYYYPHWGSCSYDLKPLNGISLTDQRIYVMDKNNHRVYGTGGDFIRLSTNSTTMKSTAHDAATFNSTRTLALFSMHAEDGYDSRRARGKLYFCQIYQNGQLIRDFIPCANAQGTVGLYDLVNNQFYTKHNANNPNFIGGNTIDGHVEFMLTYPKISTTQYNRWRQTSGINQSTVQDFFPIETAWPNRNGGLCLSSASNTIYDCDAHSSNWFAPIGQTGHGNWNGSGSMIPASDTSNTSETELWVRIDNLSKLTKLSMFNGALQAHQIYEL